MKGLGTLAGFMISSCSALDVTDTDACMEKGGNGWGEEGVPVRCTRLGSWGQHGPE